MESVSQIIIDSYAMTLKRFGNGGSLWFSSPEHSPLNGLIGEVTREGRQPDENWERILNLQDKAGEAFAYWIFEKTDIDRKSSAFKRQVKKWKQAGISFKDSSIWSARTSWDPESGYIPHESLVKILTIARKLKKDDFDDKADLPT